MFFKPVKIETFVKIHMLSEGIPLLIFYYMFNKEIVINSLVYPLYDMF